MPYVNVTIGKTITQQQKDLLLRDIGGIMSVIPGKTVDNTMLRIDAGADIFMSGAHADAAFVDCRLYMPSPESAKSEWNDKMCALLKEHAGVKQVYVNFVELEHWGTPGGYR